MSRTPEYHLRPVALLPADVADFGASVLQRRDIDPQLAPARWLKCLQRAICDWANAAGQVRTLHFRHYHLRSRPAERASPSRSPQMLFPVRRMLSSVGRFTVAAQSMLGSSVAVGHALKRSLVALGEGQRQQSLQEIKRRFLRRSQETRNLRRTPQQWRELQRRSRGPRVISRRFPWTARRCSNSKKHCQPCMLAGCGSRDTSTVLGMTRCTGLISGVISIS